MHGTVETVITALSSSLHKNIGEQGHTARKLPVQERVDAHKRSSHNFSLQMLNHGKGEY